MRDDFLPVTVVNGSLSRQSSGLSDQQAHARVKEAALRQLDYPNDGDPILELSQEFYRYDANRDWAFSKQTLEMVDNRAQVQVALRQPMGAFHEISYQPYNGSESSPAPSRLGATGFASQGSWPSCCSSPCRRSSPTSTPSATRAGSSGASPPWRSGSSAPVLRSRLMGKEEWPRKFATVRCKPGNVYSPNAMWGKRICRQQRISMRKPYPQRIYGV